MHENAGDHKGYMEGGGGNMGDLGHRVLWNRCP